MIGAGWARWQRWRESRVLARRAIPTALWTHTLERFAFLARRGPDELEQLRRLATLFLDRKEFSAAQGFVVSDEVAVAIAAQACLPVLHLGLEAYDGFVGIVVHPDQVLARREVVDDDGIVHAYREALAGEAMEGGPVMLSWRDVEEAGAGAHDSYNVVIHEFVHVLDLADGSADGVPPMADRAARQRWFRLMQDEYNGFCGQVERGADTVIDPYGAEGLDEFFAVAAECFFVTPRDLATAHPALYAAFAAYFRQDPARA